MPDPAVTVRELTKTYVTPDAGELTVLDVPSFDVATGEHVALVGGSGSGKTTLLHCIAGIVKPTSGQVVLHTSEGAIELHRLGESRRDAVRGRHLGYVFQTHHLLPGFTALENVLLGMSFTGRRADRTWAEDLLREVGLGDRLHYRPGKLSLGQQQRVAVARALANRPTLVLADEPTGSLDPQMAQTVLDLVRQLCTETGSALLMVTHDAGLAAQLPRTVQLTEINRAVMTTPAPAPVTVG